jgi:hypothetical protein
VNDLESTLRSRLHDLAGAAPDGDGLDDVVTVRARHQRQRRTRLAVLAVCAGLVVVAGGSTAAGTLLSSGPDGRVAVPGEVTPTAPSPEPTPTPTPVPSPSAAPSSSVPSPSAPSSAPSSSAPAPGTGDVPAGTPAAGGVVTPPRATPTTPAVEEPTVWPTEAPAEHGGSYWAVFLDVTRGDDTAGGQEALAALAELGYQGGIGDIGCTAGAVEALGLDPTIGYTGVSVFFATAADAQRFVDLYQPGVVGTAKITAYCLD